METTRPPPLPAEKSEMLSKAVYEWIETNTGGSLSSNGITWQSIDFGPMKSNFEDMHATDEVYEAYPSAMQYVHRNRVALKSAMTKKLKEMTPEAVPATSVNAEALMSSVEQSFEAEFLGDVDTDFKDYLLDCWETYTKKYTVLQYPFTAIVQSSGFGKSRLLYQLAEQTAHDDRIRVLYTCIRQSAASTGYPKATTKLNDFFFPQHCTVKYIEDRLYVAFEYAMAHWDTVGTEWIGLFSRLSKTKVAALRQRSKEAAIRRGETVNDIYTDPSNDLDISKQLGNFAELHEIVSQAQPHEVTTVEDKPADLDSREVIMHDDSDPTKLLIFAIDEARSLLAENSYKVSTYRLLRHALRNVNNTIRAKHGSNSGIFAVLVDTNSKISDLLPPNAYDPSYRVGNIERKESIKLFHPFVLTHTVDVHSSTAKRRQSLTTREFCKEMVLTAHMESFSRSWKYLVDMGRPLWRSCAAMNRKGQLRLDFLNMMYLIAFAAKKLLLGANIEEPTAFTEINMYGVASVLCRVGLRPFSSSALASRAVADFMATLCYVNYKHDLYVVNYFSDPVLTFGAAYVWHKHEGQLGNFILPQLRKLFMQEALDTGEIGETVARIVLLLAMDKCAKVSESNVSGLTRFHHVPEFMDILRGPSVKLRDGGNVDHVKHILDRNWNGWRIGFSHFIQLTKEPSDNCLWYLLSRRAAGIFPRNQGGADLFIPIFAADDDGQNPSVSMVLVQVKNYAHGYYEYADAVEKLNPAHVFAEENPFSQRHRSDFLRVVMRMRKNTKSSYEYDEGCLDESACVLFMGALNATSFVPAQVAHELNLLLSPWWDLLELVGEDLARRSKDETRSPHVVPEETLRKIAEMPVHDLVHIDD